MSETLKSSSHSQNSPFILLQGAVTVSMQPKEASGAEPSTTAPMFQRTLSEALLMAHNNSTNLDDVNWHVSSMHVGPVAPVFSGDAHEKSLAQTAVHGPHAPTESAVSKTPGSLRVVSSSSGQVCYDYIALFEAVQVLALAAILMPRNLDWLCEDTSCSPLLALHNQHNKPMHEGSSKRTWCMHAGRE